METAGSVRALISSAFLLRCGQSAAAVIIALYLGGLHGSRGGVPVWISAVLLSSSYGIELFVAPLMGALSDRFGRRLFIIVGPLIGWAALQIYPLTGLLLLIFIARGLEGVSAATLTPATLGFLADNTSGTQDERSKAMSYYEIAVLVGIGSGYAIGGFLWANLGLASFQAAGALYLASAAVVWLWVSKTQQVRRSRRTDVQGYLRVLRQPRMLRFVPAWLCVTAIFGLWFNNVIRQLAGSPRDGQLLAGGFTAEQVSVILGGFTLTLIVGTFVWSRLYARFARRTSIMVISLGALLVVGIDLLIFNHWADDSRLLAYVLLPLLVVGIGTFSGFTPAALAYLADMSEGYATDRGIIMGVYSIVLSLGAVAGGVAGGPFAQAWGVDGMIFLTLLLAGLATWTLVLLRRADSQYARQVALQPSGA